MNEPITQNDLNKLPDTISYPRFSTHSPAPVMTTYSKSLAIDIIHEIISSHSNVEKICKDKGVSPQMWYLWLYYCPPLLDIYYRAKAIRCETKLDYIDFRLSELDDYVHDDNNDARDKHARIQYMHLVTKHEQWRAAALNDRYRSKQSIDSNIHTDDTQVRQESWSQWRAQATDAQVTDVPGGECSGQGDGI